MRIKSKYAKNGTPSPQNGITLSSSDEKTRLLPSKSQSGLTKSSFEKPTYNRRQWAVFIVICVANLFSAMMVSLQGPFFPHEAEKKGVSPGVYGFVFGIFQLVNFIACPIYGKYIRVIGPKFMLNGGNFVMAFCCILFGFLDHVPSGVPFISLAFIVRIVEALGQAGYMTASYAIIAHEFPDRIASTFSVLETVFGLGLIAGPALGGLLYEVGGYPVPFMTVGILLLVSTACTALLLPHIEDTTEKSNSFLKLLRLPSILISYYSVFAVAFSIGFIEAILEPHVRQFGLSAALTGLLFVVSGGVYTLTAAIWGFLADNHIHPKVLCGAAGILVVVSFSLIGPAPFLPIQPKLWLVILALVLHGLGCGGEFVAAFVDSTQVAISSGLPNSIDTYGLVASMWGSGLALGTFAGSSLSGVLLTSVGFRNASQVVLVLHLLVVVFCFGYVYREMRKEKLKLEYSNGLTKLNAGC